MTSALSRHGDVVILGHGNVALDCARVLAKSVTDPVTGPSEAGKELARSDIASYAMPALGRGLAAGAVRRVSIVGRRGFLPFSFFEFSLSMQFFFLRGKKGYKTAPVRISIISGTKACQFDPLPLYLHSA